MAEVEHHVADLIALPFESEMFDAAYAERVFIWLSDPDAAMGELFRVLRPGGCLVVVDPDHPRVATDADDRAHLADQDARAAEGRFLVSTARNLVEAVKPGG